VPRQNERVVPHKVDERLLEAETEAEGVIELLEPGLVSVA
jgi:hypothetical protein